VSGASAQDFGDLEATGAAKETNFADFLVVFVSDHADSVGVNVGGETMLVDKAQAFLRALAAQHNVVKVASIVATDAAGKHELVRHGGVRVLFEEKVEDTVC
jgi:hypothetical protein